MFHTQRAGLQIFLLFWLGFMMQKYMLTNYLMHLVLSTASNHLHK